MTISICYARFMEGRGCLVATGSVHTIVLQTGAKEARVCAFTHVKVQLLLS